MKKLNILSVALVAGSIFGAGAALASIDRAAGRVLMVDGSVLIQRIVQTDIASVGSVISVGDSVLTTDTGVTQWTMSDDSLFALAPNSGLKINNYVMPSSTNSAGVASYVLLNGAVHTITGRIGKATTTANAPRGIYTASTSRFNAANLIKVLAAPTGPYTLKTAMAVITTKGADYAASQTAKVTEVLVNAGSVTVCTISGCASANAGEGVVVNCEGCKPTIVPGITLGLSALNSNVAFNLRDALITGQVHDPRSNPPSPSQGCSTVAAQLQNATSCSPGGGNGGGNGNGNGNGGGTSGGSGPGVPVSPN